MERVYTESFYSDMHRKKNTCRRAVEYVYDLLHPKSVVDIGCGTGEWLALFKECGVLEIRGYDGDYVKKDWLAITEDEFTVCDLSQEIVHDRNYDLAMSLEVAEHLDECHADRFVRDLSNFSDVILFSAAIPGQGGDGHVNEQWSSYWQTKFEANGFTCCDCIRDFFWDVEELDYYYKQNTVLFVQNSNKKLIEKLQSLEKRNMRDIVHPVAYLKYKLNLEIMSLLLNDAGGIYIRACLEKLGIHSLAIYGTGRLGKYFYDICKRSKVKIPFCIDERTDYTIDTVPTRFYKEVTDQDVDCIVLASGYHYQEMKRNLIHFQKTMIISLEELLKMSQSGENVRINGI